MKGKAIQTVGRGGRMCREGKIKTEGMADKQDK